VIAILAATGGVLKVTQLWGYFKNFSPSYARAIGKLMPFSGAYRHP
jgi:hypothetical protein